MPCYYPRQVAYLYARNLKTGNRIVYWSIPPNLPPSCYEVVKVSCKKCIGCRLDYSQEWGARVYHESFMNEDNCFITLTYSNDKLPEDLSLNYVHYQKFMKRLREYVASRRHMKRFGFVVPKIRFFMAGEYGDEFGRPHFHACIFGYDFPDKYYWKSSGGYSLYCSDFLDEMWRDPDDGINYGYSSIGSVTLESAAYVARYCIKKRSGAIAPEYYRRLHIDEDTGEILEVFDIQPEFSHQSTNPGIGYEWFRKYHMSDVYVEDHVSINGRRIAVPTYYDNKFKIEHGDDFEEIKARRKARALLDADNNTYDRLRVREEVHKAKASMLVRNLR